MLRPTGGQERDVLYRGEAAGRAARIRDVSYGLRFELYEGRDTYIGRAEIDFGLTSTDEPIFLDFTGRPVRMVVNGTSVSPHHRDHRLLLPTRELAPTNRILLEYENAFDLTGDGFHRFIDPSDGETYLYSNLEPFSAHRLFPCFDQPDIKATYRLSVTAPPAWRVISADAPVSIAALPDGRRRHDFPVTPLFSTYLFPLIAGPYERVEGRHGDTPLGLFGRRSMRHELEDSADEILEVTAQGLDCYADLFGRPFPFTKYDQLFVPEFNAGAMENVAAVTFHDRFLFREAPTYLQRLVRGEVILHELAHMWFGDLVTMRWWDDLWLNETFATYLSYRCLAAATVFRDAWQVFNGEMRPAAHRQDQLVTTHPVATSVEHTDQAVGNFDAITYEKGAAVIRQLVAAIGDEAFRDGLQRYFDRYAWGNATLADLLGALGEAAGYPLTEWARVWLRSAGLNTISVQWSSSDGRVRSLEVLQTAPESHPVLRPHATTIGLVQAAPQGGTLAVEAIPVRVDGARQNVPEAVGHVEPLFVYPNLGDDDYALARLDARSLAFALERLPELPDALLRQQVWSTLWEMVRAGELPPADYLAGLRRFAPGERDGALVESILDRASEVLRRYLDDDQAARAGHELLDTAITALVDDQAGIRLAWARAACGLAGDAGAISHLFGLVDGDWSVDGFELDQDLRWLLAIKAAAFGLPDAEDRLEEERRRDGSDRGQRALIRAATSRPDEAVKAVALERINGEGYGSDYLTRAAIMGFQWRHQRALLVPYRERFYEQVEEVFRTRDHAFAATYLRWLVPDRWAEAEELDRLRSFAAGLGDGQHLLRRLLEETADDMARDIRVRTGAAGAGIAGATSLVSR